MTKVLGGAAQPVKVMTGGKRIGGPARRVYGYAAAPTDGRKALGGPALPVVVLTDADLKENGGSYVLDGLPYAMPVYTAPADAKVTGGPAIPVYPVNAWPPSTAEAGLEFVSAEIGTVNATTLVVTYSKAPTGSPSLIDGLTVMNGATQIQIVSATPQADPKVVYYTLGAAVANGDSVTLQYTQV